MNLSISRIVGKVAAELALSRYIKYKNYPVIRQKIEEAIEKARIRG